MAHVPVHFSTVYPSEANLPFRPSSNRNLSVETRKAFAKASACGHPNIERTGADILANLYENVPPAGVTLVVDACLGDLARFIEMNPTAFREKTQSVIYVGGAELTKEHRETSAEHESGNILVPDPAAQNNSLDLDGARRVFKYAQESLVKLVVLSRHFSRHVRVPREFFDGLASHGGLVGERIMDAQKAGLYLLWDAANAHPSEIERRRALPERCNKRWFVNTFCQNANPTFQLGFFDDVWNSVGQLHVYTPLALMASLPQLMNRVVKGTDVTVRGVKHTLYGSEAGLGSTESSIGFKSVLFQALFMGARSNISDFNLGYPPPLPLTESGLPLWHFDPHYKALDYLLPSACLPINVARLRSENVDMTSESPRV
jgi:hypothetical protein